MKQTTDNYFTINDNGRVTALTLWDGAEAVLRGKCIQIAVKRRQRKEKEIKLENELKRLKHEHKMTGGKNVLKQLQDCRAKGVFRYTKQRYYEMGT